MKNNRLREISKELTISAEYIGEEGDMTCVARTKNSAFKKFSLLVLGMEGVGENARLKFQNISRAYLHLVSELKEEEKAGELAECEWFISYKKSPYKVWTYYED
jgi:hypothetical protein